MESAAPRSVNAAEVLNTAQVLEIITQEEAIARIQAAGYRREPCAACNGAGHYVIVNENAHDWKKYLCETCRGAGATWRAPN